MVYLRSFEDLIMLPLCSKLAVVLRWLLPQSLHLSRAQICLEKFGECRFCVSLQVTIKWFCNAVRQHFSLCFVLCIQIGYKNKGHKICTLGIRFITV